MDAPTVNTATEAEMSKVIQTIVLGFASDPVARWCWPEPETYLEAMPKFVSAYGGRAFRNAAAYIVDGYRGAALWLPPDEEPDESSLEEVIGDTMSEQKQTDIGAALEELGTYHPTEPHWYLPLIAVDPYYQGQGIGAALMKHAVRRCDEDETKAYLESTNPRNISLYERHGFEVVGEVQAGSVPLFTAMIRLPR